MTIHPLLLIGLIVIIVGLALAYIGAWSKAMILQTTVDNLWPILQALGRAMDAAGGSGKADEAP